MKKPDKKDTGKGPRIGVFVCNCGTNIAGFLEAKAVADYASGLPNVVFVRENLYSCSEAGINDIRQGIIDNKLEGVVVAACTPRTHEPTFRAACEDAGLNPYFFEFVNIREHCSWVHKEEREAATQKAKDLIRMGVARAAYLEPMEPIIGDVTRRALVIGGGISGMTASLELAGRGFEVVLVEKQKQLGGLLKAVNWIYPHERPAREYVKGLVDRVGKARRMKVLKSSEVTEVKGYIGKYIVSITSLKKPVTTGIIIVATGAEVLVPEGQYGFDSKRVVTQLQLEDLLARSKSRPGNVVMIGCVGARTRERFYCSRICCMTAIKNAVLIRKKWKSDVTMLYRDLMCYGIKYEALLMEAKEAGVRFVNYPDDGPPVAGKGEVRVTSAILGREMVLPYDLLVLETPLVPAGTNEALSRMLKVPLDEYGFFLEAHVKLRPLDFATDGIFVCGTARWPASIRECVEQALGAASRASTFLESGRVKVEPIVSFVTEDDCRGCGLCVALCPYGAIELVKTEAGEKARTIDVACKGCGTCGATCYRGAITMKHYSDEQLTAQIRAAFKKE
ncbi:MAG: CoB--CoM heterodisulfide reductase iron-sulfur subunit A family protein [Candidatus Eisenbacteria bacterium]